MFVTDLAIVFKYICIGMYIWSFAIVVVIHNHKCDDNTNHNLAYWCALPYSLIEFRVVVINANDVYASNQMQWQLIIVLWKLRPTVQILFHRMKMYIFVFIVKKSSDVHWKSIWNRIYICDSTMLRNYTKKMIVVFLHLARKKKQLCSSCHKLKLISEQPKNWNVLKVKQTNLAKRKKTHISKKSQYSVYFNARSKSIYHQSTRLERTQILFCYFYLIQRAAHK